MVIKGVKYLECNKNNKRYMDISQDSLNYVKDDTYGKLDVVLDDLEAIQAHIH